MSAPDKPQGQIIGYARTSTRDQSAGLEDQIAELNRAGASRVFAEHISGTKIDRPELEKALDYVREGDKFVVTKPDRLARSVRHLMDIKERLESKRVALSVLSMGLDTSTSTGKLMLGVLASVAEFEREIMLERQQAGIARAKAQGKYKGRPPSVDRDRVKELLSKLDSPTKVAKEMGISVRTVYRLASATQGSL